LTGKPQWTIAFQNVQDVFHFYKFKMLPETRKMDDGHLIRYHTQGTFSSVFNLSMFPFDRQLLKIKISLDIPSSIARIGKVEVFKDKENFDALLNSEWEIDKSQNNGDPYVMQEDRSASDVGSYGNSYSTVTIAQNIKRNPNHFIMTAFFPLFIIMSCSFIMIHPIDIIKLMLGTCPSHYNLKPLKFYVAMQTKATRSSKWTSCHTYLQCCYQSLPSASGATPNPFCFYRCMRLHASLRCPSLLQQATPRRQNYSLTTFSALSTKCRASRTPLPLPTVILCNTLSAISPCSISSSCRRIGFCLT
jgi:hypothetical protein